MAVSLTAQNLILGFIHWGTWTWCAVFWTPIIASNGPLNCHFPILFATFGSRKMDLSGYMMVSLLAMDFRWDLWERHELSGTDQDHRIPRATNVPGHNLPTKTRKQRRYQACDRDSSYSPSTGLRFWYTTYLLLIAPDHHDHQCELKYAFKFEFHRNVIFVQSNPRRAVDRSMHTNQLLRCTNQYAGHFRATNRRRSWLNTIASRRSQRSHPLPAEGHPSTSG